AAGQVLLELSSRAGLQRRNIEFVSGVEAGRRSDVRQCRYRAADRIDVVRIRVARIQIETQRAKGLIQRLQLGSLAASALTVGGETLAAAEGGGRLDAAPVDLVQCEVDLQRVERPELASQLVAPHRVGS